MLPYARRALLAFRERNSIPILTNCCRCRKKNAAASVTAIRNRVRLMEAIE